jgi:signal transduction protein with GAF and PtsI domain
MTATHMGLVKAVLRSLDVEATRRFVLRQAEAPVHSVRGALHMYARDRGFDLPPEPPMGVPVLA